MAPDDNVAGGRSLAKSDLLPALFEEWDALADLGRSLGDDEWDRPSILPGWSVHDVFSHVIGTESMLNGDPLPEATRDVKELAHVKNDIAATNELWIDEMRGLGRSDELERFAAITADRVKALEAMTEDEFAAPSWTPAGNATYSRFMRIRVYDCWMHEHDVRDAIGTAGHESGRCAETAFDEIETALGFVVGKKAAAPAGSRVTFDITGDVARTVHVVVADRASVVHELEDPPTVVLSTSSHVFSRLTGGRIPPAAHAGDVDITGDADLGRRILENLPFTI